MIAGMVGSRTRHVCPTPLLTSVVAKIEKLHPSQAGRTAGKETGRHACPRCAYVEGKRAGAAEQAADERRRKWTLPGPTEICRRGHAAPLETITRIRARGRAEGRARWACASCAWTLGWRDGVQSVKADPKDA